MTFKYKGYTFEPAGKVAGTFDQLARRCGRGLINNYEKKDAYDYAEFYAASGGCEDDLFLCRETGNYYLPGEHELFLFLNPNGSAYRPKAGK